ncbi:heme utilization cystosolic carrier protein HutX [Desulfovibrio falkowii]|uniref:Heme utilization cystosolic carrier protein HutX n=1 Tax=Desulfovibrio falkowii TaxID=3136602 RepID=A0ABQ0E6E7_9BACT
MTTCPATPCQTESLHQQVEKMLAEKKMVMLDTIARQCSVSELCAAEALPPAMRAFTRETDFDAVWDGLTRWPGATFIMRHGRSVVEIKGCIPSGKHGGGYFNLVSGQPLGGHICSEEVAHICFLSLPFMGLESHSVQFFDAAGAVLFSVYVGRENKKLIPEARDGFFALREAFGKENI